ncbi:MAG: hypothetical protein ACREBU_25570 [Nitrososphaera sp.]
MAIMRKEVPSGSLSNAMLGNTLYLTLQKLQKTHHLDEPERSILERGHTFFTRAVEGKKAFEHRLMGWSAVEDSTIYGTVLEVVRRLRTETKEEPHKKVAKGVKPPDFKPQEFIQHYLDTFDKLISGKPTSQRELALLLDFFRTLRTSALNDLQREQPYERVHVGLRSR